MSGGQVSPLFSVLISCPGSTNGRRDARKPSIYIIPTLSPVEKNVCFNIFLRKFVPESPDQALLYGIKSKRARKETIPNGVWEKTFSLYDLRWQRTVVSRI